MVKIITCCRTTSRLPSPLPFNSLFFSFLLLSHAFFSLLTASSLPLSLSILSFFPFFQSPDLALFLVSVPRSKFPSFSLSGVLLSSGSSSSVLLLTSSTKQRFTGGMGFLSW